MTFNLDDKYTSSDGKFVLSGIQAIVKLALLQKEIDERAGLKIYATVVCSSKSLTKVRRSIVFPAPISPVSTTTPLPSLTPNRRWPRASW